MKKFEYCIYWMEEREPASAVFDFLPKAEIFSCVIRGKKGVEYVEVIKKAKEELLYTEDSIL